MSAQTSPTLPGAEVVALGILRYLVSAQGVVLVSDVLGVILGTGPGMLIEDVSLLIADVLRALLPALGADRVQSEVSAMLDAADVAADAAEAAKFGTKP